MASEFGTQTVGPPTKEAYQTLLDLNSGLVAALQHSKLEVEYLKHCANWFTPFNSTPLRANMETTNSFFDECDNARRTENADMVYYYGKVFVGPWECNTRESKTGTLGVSASSTVLHAKTQEHNGTLSASERPALLLTISKPICGQPKKVADIISDKNINLNPSSEESQILEDGLNGPEPPLSGSEARGNKSVHAPGVVEDKDQRVSSTKSTDFTKAHDYDISPTDLDSSGSTLDDTAQVKAGPKLLPPIELKDKLNTAPLCLSGHVIIRGKPFEEPRKLAFPEPFAKPSRSNLPLSPLTTNFEEKEIHPPPLSSSATNNKRTAIHPLPLSSCTTNSKQKDIHPGLKTLSAGTWKRRLHPRMAPLSKSDEISAHESQHNNTELSFKMDDNKTSGVEDQTLKDQPQQVQPVLIDLEDEPEILSVEVRKRQFKFDPTAIDYSPGQLRPDISFDTQVAPEMFEMVEPNSTLVTNVENQVGKDNKVDNINIIGDHVTSPCDSTVQVDDNDNKPSSVNIIGEHVISSPGSTIQVYNKVSSVNIIGDQVTSALDRAADVNHDNNKTGDEMMSGLLATIQVSEQNNAVEGHHVAELQDTIHVKDDDRIGGFCRLGLSEHKVEHAGVFGLDNVINWKIPGGYNGFTSKVASAAAERSLGPMGSRYWDEGLRYQPGPAHLNQYRTVMITGIPDDAMLRDVTAVIRGGPLVSIDLVGLPKIMSKCSHHKQEWHTRCMVARVVFLHENAALYFENLSKDTGFYISGERLTIKLVSTPTFPMNDNLVELVYEDKATRVLTITRTLIHGPADDAALIEKLNGEKGMIKIEVVLAGEEWKIECQGVLGAYKIKLNLIKKGIPTVKYTVDPCDK